jgi:uncharacterized membrane protein YdjX (TVP38/TMEM64 family)
MTAGNFIRRYKWRLLAGLLLAVALAYGLYQERDELTRENLMRYGTSLPAVWLLVAFFLLPLVGFPISVGLLLLGIRFGFWMGMLAATFGMAFHHVVAFYAVHGSLRDWIHHKLDEKWDYQVPKMGNRSASVFTMIFTAVHGPPYTLKLYFLALTDVPFRIYFWVGLPVYLLFSVVAVGAGSAVMDFDPTWAYVLIGVMTVLAVGSRWVKNKYGKE